MRIHTCCEKANTCTRLAYVHAQVHRSNVHHLTGSVACRCPDCPLVLTVGTSNTVSVTIKMDGALIQDDQKSSARRDKDLPTVQEECPSCGNDTAYYRTMQLRSADEGQTIFYTCTNAACGWKWKQDS